jgi:hypothetical protein
LLVALVALVAWPTPTLSAATATDAPVAHVALASCDDHDNQAEAQRAKDTRDADGIYCEDLPRPCLPPDPRAGGAAATSRPSKKTTQPAARGLTAFSGWSSMRTSTPASVGTFRIALRKGWPRRLIVNRPGADARRDRLLEDIPTKEDFDRDAYPPAIGRGKGLERGRNPPGWKAHVRYVPSSENRSHGAALGNKLEDFCNSTRYRYVFR